MTVPDLPPDPALSALRREVAYPSVALLVPTTPAGHLSETDRRTLTRMAAIAVGRLETELDHSALAAIRTRLATVISASGAAGSDNGLVVFVSPRRCQSMLLDFAPRPRVVVDRAFATRDLAAAWASSPSYRVLVLSSIRFRVLEGRHQALTDVEPPRTPRPLPVPCGPRSGTGRRRRGCSETWVGRNRRADRLLADAERAVERRRRHQPLPLILIGASRWTRRFQARSHHRRDIVAVTTGTHIYDRPSRIAAIAGPALDDWVAARNAAVVAELDTAAVVAELDTAAEVAELDTAADTGRLQWGLPVAWAAAAAGQVERLWVADDYAPAARPSLDGTRVDLTDRREDPGVIDDAADDDLIKVVTAMGGTAHQVPSAVLGGGHPPVATLIRTRRHDPTRTARRSEILHSSSIPTESLDHTPPLG